MCFAGRGQLFIAFSKGALKVEHLLFELDDLLLEGCGRGRARGGGAEPVSPVRSVQYGRAVRVWAAGIAFVAYFPLAAGMLRPGLDLSQAPPGMAPSAGQLAVLDEIAARYGATRAQVALAWLLGHSPVTLAIPGTSSLAHLEENMAAARLSLSGEDIAVLDKLA